MATLSEDPLPAGCQKLRGSERAYRIRFGNYRVIYSVYADSLLVEIVRVGHRKDIYRQLT